MQYLVLSDVHLGCITLDMISKLQVLLAQHKDKTVIWAGDIIDVLMVEKAYDIYPNFIQSGDVHLLGNHDYDSKLTSSKWINLDQNKVFITHGDLVDFGLGFSLLQHFNYAILKTLIKKKQFSLITILTLLRLFKQWSVEDCHLMYKEMLDLSDEDVTMFHHTDKLKLKHFKSYFNLLKNLIKTKSHKIKSNLTANDVSNCINQDKHYWGLMTHDPKLLLERTLVMYPESVDADTIIIGHIHHQADQVIKASNGKEYRIIILGAWVGNVIPSYVLLDDASMTLEVKEIKN